MQQVSTRTGEFAPMSCRGRAGLHLHAPFDPEDGDEPRRLRRTARREARLAGRLLRRRDVGVHARPDRQCRRARDGTGAYEQMAPYWQSSDRGLRQADERDPEGRVLADPDRGDLAGVHDLPRHRQRHGRAQSPGRRPGHHVRRRDLRPGAESAGSRRRVPDQRPPDCLRLRLPALRRAGGPRTPGRTPLRYRHPSRTPTPRAEAPRSVPDWSTWPRSWRLDVRGFPTLAWRLWAMPFVTTDDGTEIFYKDWGPRRPADRVPPRLAAELRRLGRPDDVLPRSTATAWSPTTAAATAGPARSPTGTTWTTTPPMPPRWSSTSTCATPSTSATRPAAARSPATSPATASGRVAKAVLISAVPPLMLKTDANPGGLPIEVFDGFRAGHRLQPGPVLPRRRLRPVLRLQPPGREGLRGHHPATGGARA